ncbi:hypothetical protein KCP74_05050 [Salmonella enterica subsp. enterica]|nr:hypothetical protein KCP74_05050 [Salmonella enterica subsp. enterica]
MQAFEIHLRQRKIVPPLLAGDKPRRCLAVDKHCAEIHSAGIPVREVQLAKAKKGKTNYDIGRSSGRGT